MPNNPELCGGCPVVEEFPSGSTQDLATIAANLLVRGKMNEPQFRADSGYTQQQEDAILMCADRRRAEKCGTIKG